MSLRPRAPQPFGAHYSGAWTLRAAARACAYDQPPDGPRSSPRWVTADPDEAGRDTRLACAAAPVEAVPASPLPPGGTSSDPGGRPGASSSTVGPPSGAGRGRVAG